MENLLLIYRLEPLRQLPSYVVRSNNPGSVSRIAVEEGGAPLAQTAKVVTLLLHVSGQLPTSKRGGSPGLLVGDPFMPVVCPMCADVGNVVAEPGSQVCRRGKRGPINAHL